VKLLILTPPGIPAPEFSECLKLLRLQWTPDETYLPRLHFEYEFTHVLYTSSAHSFLTWDEKSIHAAYSFVGSPRCLFSAHRDIDPPEYRSIQLRTHRRIYREICTSSFMGEILYLHKNLDRFRRGELERQDYKGEHGVKLDKLCEVFQNLGADGHRDVSWDAEEGYFYNKATQSTPCVLSFTEGRPGIRKMFKLWKRQWRKQQTRKALASGYERNA